MAMSSNTVDTLNSLLRGEIAATETYQQAMAKVGGEVGVADLRRIHEEHREAANTLRQHVHTHGGQPDQGSGAWGSFAKLVEGGAKVFGAKSAIAALEEGEDHGRDDYKRELDELSPDVRRLVESELLPEQLRTHDALSALRHNL